MEGLESFIKYNMHQERKCTEYSMIFMHKKKVIINAGKAQNCRRYPMGAV